jgi:exodeoxyribonuclease VII small subunit|tara:strand:- start:191 stop:442 length:252 start_codon:yes stop_codon:yes gene_type:complete
LNGKKVSDEDPDFESALAELEALVANMETGEFTLEESLVAFERGVELTRQCRNALEHAELRIRALMPDGSEVPIDDVDTDTDE